MILVPDVFYSVAVASLKFSTTRTSPGSSPWVLRWRCRPKVVVNLSSEIDVEWSEGGCNVTWRCHGLRVEKNFPCPPSSVAVWSEPLSVIVVEPIVNSGRLDNAIVFEPSGTERLRLAPPAVTPESSWRLGYYAVFVSNGVLTAVFSTRVGDYWGVPDLVTGKLREVVEWR